MFWKNLFRRKKLSEVSLDETGKIIEPKVEEEMTVDDWLQFLREGTKFIKALGEFLDEENKKKKKDDNSQNSI